MLDSNKPGFFFQSNVEAWDDAFYAAIEFIKKSQDHWNEPRKYKLILGPKINDYARDWIFRTYYEKSNRLLGNVILRWSDWLRQFAREKVLAQEGEFREVSLVRSRHILRECLGALEGAGKLTSVGKNWREERFFSLILEEVNSLRTAGFDEENEILRARELLKDGDSELRVDPEELWYILRLYDQSLAENEYDYCRILRAAGNYAGNESDTTYFFLGFDSFFALEAAFLKQLSLANQIILPVSGIARDDHPVIKSLTSFYNGNISYQTKAASDFKIHVLVGHTPLEEALSASAWLKAKKTPAQLVLSGNTALDLVQGAMCFGLGIENADYLSKREDRRLHSLLLEVLKGANSKFDGEYLGKLCQLLQVVTGEQKFRDLPGLLLESGYRDGIDIFKNLKVPEAYQEYWEALTRYSQKLRAIPDEASLEFYEKLAEEILKDFFKSYWILPKSVLAERQAHFSLAVFLKALVQLKTLGIEKWHWSELIEEVSALCETQCLESRVNDYLSFSWFRLGEWLPPTNSVRLVLGLDRGSMPTVKNYFYFDDTVRTRLRDWDFETQKTLDQITLEWFSCFARKNNGFISYAKHSSEGNSQEPSWILDVFAHAKLEWPESPWPNEVKSAGENIKFVLSKKSGQRVSVSLLNSYGSCPFKAWMQNIGRVEDSVIESDLDLPHLEKGAVIHKALELYFTKHDGITARTDSDIQAKAKLSLEEAFREQRWPFYKGGSFLLEMHFNEVFRKMFAFLKSQAEYFSNFSDLQAMECEVPFELHFADIPVSGKIDRIDWSKDRKQFLVVDYKSGATSPSNKEILDNKNLQLQMYLFAAQLKNAQAQPAGAYFLKLNEKGALQGLLKKQFRKSAKSEGPFYFDTGPTNKALLEDEKFAEILQGSQTTAINRVKEIAEGNYSPNPSDPKECDKCEYRPSCRFVYQTEFDPKISANSLEDFLSLEDRLAAAESTTGTKSIPQLTEEQQTVLSKKNQFVFVEASAGTGKTTVIVEKIVDELARLGQKTDIEKAIKNIWAISFTEKSAQELQARLVQRLAPIYGPVIAAAAGNRVSTIHGLCGQIVRDFPAIANVSPLATTLAPLEAKEFQSRVLEEMFVSPSPEEAQILKQLYEIYTRRHLFSAILDLSAKRTLLAYDTSVKVIPGSSEELIYKLYESFISRYDEEKSNAHVMDLNDLERLAIIVLEQKQAFYRKQITLLVVDEFQDTNSTQRKIVEGIANRNSLFLVGDAKQSIYRFRDADVSIFESLKSQAGETNQLFSLSKNFRSQENIVEFVNSLCSRFMPGPQDSKQPYEASFASATAVKEPGDKVKVLWFEEANKVEQAQYLAQEIKNLVAQGRKPNEIAILFKKLSGNEEFIDVLRSSGIQTIQEGGEDFFALSLLNDGISLLRSVQSYTNRSSLVALFRGPWFSFAPEKIESLVRDRKEIGMLLQPWTKLYQEKGACVLLSTAYLSHPQMVDVRKRVQVEKFVNWISKLEDAKLSDDELILLITKWSGFFNKDSGIKEKCVPDKGDTNCVKISTVHASKGLEYPIVFLVDLDSRGKGESNPIRYYPSLGLCSKNPEEEEEGPEFERLAAENKNRESAESKRLFYVAMTRAKEKLIFLAAKEGGKSDSWGNFLRQNLEFLDLEQKYLSTALSLISESKQEVITRDFPAPKWPKNTFPQHASVSEFSAFEFCEIFHEKKFVKEWEDKVLEVMPKAKLVRKKKGDDDQALLKELGIERKERGIALHRILERMDTKTSRTTKLSWLKEIYVSQGIVPSQSLEQLMEMDLDLLDRFLLSPPGKSLFADAAEFYPELNFRFSHAGFSVAGSIDRVVKTHDQKWIVADYKSSLNQDNVSRYTLQVWLYIWALRKALQLPENGIHGILIDLYSLDWHQVNANVWNESSLLENIEKIKSGYRESLQKPVSGGEKCFHCPYVRHCDEGQKFVLGF